MSYLDDLAELDSLIEKKSNVSTQKPITKPKETTNYISKDLEELDSLIEAKKQPQQPVSPVVDNDGYQKITNEPIFKGQQPVAPVKPVAQQPQPKNVIDDNTFNKIINIAQEGRIGEVLSRVKNKIKQTPVIGDVASGVSNLASMVKDDYKNKVPDIVKKGLSNAVTIAFPTIGLLKRTEEITRPSKEEMINTLPRLDNPNPLDIMDEIKDVMNNPVKLVGYLGSAKGFRELEMVGNSFKKIEDNTANKSDYELVRAFQLEASKDRTFGNRVAQIVTALPAFAMEFASTGGIKQGVGKGAEKLFAKALSSQMKKKVSQKLASYALTKALPTAIGSAPQALIAGTTRIPEDITRRMLPTLQITKEDNDKYNYIVTDRGETTGEATKHALINQYIETFSEHLGENFDDLFKAGMKTGVAKKAKEKLSKLALKNSFIESISRFIPKKDLFPRLENAVKLVGFNGVLNEILEERVGDGLKALTGLDSWGEVLQRWGDPTQWLAEAVAFGIPGSAINLTNLVQQQINKNKEVIPNEEKTKETEVLGQQTDKGVILNEKENQVQDVSTEQQNTVPQAENITQEVNNGVVTNDKENIAGIPSQEQTGQTTIQTEPIQGTSQETVSTGGNVQENELANQETVQDNIQGQAQEQTTKPEPALRQGRLGAFARRNNTFEDFKAGLINNNGRFVKELRELKDRAKTIIEEKMKADPNLKLGDVKKEVSANILRDYWRYETSKTKKIKLDPKEYTPNQIEILQQTINQLEDDYFINKDNQGGKPFRTEFGDYDGTKTSNPFWKELGESDPNHSQYLELAKKRITEGYEFQGVNYPPNLRFNIDDYEKEVKTNPDNFEKRLYENLIGSLEIGDDIEAIKFKELIDEYRGYNNEKKKQDTSREKNISQQPTQKDRTAEKSDKQIKYYEPSKDDTFYRGGTWKRYFYDFQGKDDEVMFVSIDPVLHKGKVWIEEAVFGVEESLNGFGKYKAFIRKNINEVSVGKEGDGIGANENDIRISFIDKDYTSKEKQIIKEYTDYVVNKYLTLTRLVQERVVNDLEEEARGKALEKQKEAEKPQKKTYTPEQQAIIDRGIAEMAENAKGEKRVSLQLVPPNMRLERGVKEAVDYFNSKNIDNDTIFKFINDKMTLGKLYEKNLIDKKTYEEYIKEAPLFKDQAYINGSNGYSDSMNKYVVRLYKTANITTVIEEVSEIYYKKRIKDNPNFETNIKRWRTDFEKQTGVKNNKQDIEWFSDLAVDYAIHKKFYKHINMRLRDIFDRISFFARQVLDRTNRLRIFIKDGKVNKDLIDELNSSVFGKDNKSLQIQDKKEFNLFDDVPDDMRRTKVIKTTNESREKARNKPVMFTEGKKRLSTAQRKLLLNLEEGLQEEALLNGHPIADTDIKMLSMKLLENDIKATEFVNDNWDRALAVANGLDNPPEGIGLFAIMNEVAIKQFKEGKTSEALFIFRRMSEMATRFGQENASLAYVYMKNSGIKAVNQISDIRAYKYFKFEYKEGEPLPKNIRQRKNTEINNEALKLKKQIDLEVRKKLKFDEFMKSILC